MEIKDRKMIEKDQKYDLMEIRLLRPRHVAVKDPRGRNYLDQKDGIVRIMKDPYQSDEGFKTVQEQHNANHALYYFSMITEGIIRGRLTGGDSEKIKRIRAHMINLREYIGDDKAGLRVVINTLLEELDEFGPRYHNRFSLLIHENWAHLWAFARAYGHHETCFSHDQYQKLSDVVFGKCYLKLWWWKMQAERFLVAFRGQLDQVRP